MINRRLLPIVAGTVVLIAGIGTLAVRSDRQPPMDPPNPDLSELEPQVAEKIRSLRDLVQNKPRSAVTWGRYAMNLDAHNLTREAIIAYQHAAQLDPDEARWPYFCAIAMRGMYAGEAVEWFERARRLQPEYTPLLIRYAAALADVGRFDDADQSYRDVLRIDRRSSHAHLGLARLALARDQLDSSAIHLRQAIEISPGHGEAHGLLAEVYRRMGRSDHADLQQRRARHFVRSTPLVDPVFVAVVKEGASSHWFLRRGKSYMQSRLYDAALGEFRAAWDVRPDAETRFHLGLAMQYLGSDDSAATHYRAALRHRPHYADALQNLAIVLVELGDVPGAVESAKRAAQIAPTAESYLILADTYGKSGNAALAIETLQRGAAQQPYDYRIGTKLAWYLATARSAALRNGAEAVKLALDARDVVANSDVDVLDALAAAYAETGDFDKAVTTAVMAQKLAAATQQRDRAEAIRARLSRYENRQPFRGT